MQVFTGPFLEHIDLTRSCSEFFALLLDGGSLQQLVLQFSNFLLVLKFIQNAVALESS